MRNKSFGDFVDKKKRDSLKQLKLVEKMLSKSGIKTENYLETDDSDDPYVYCYNPSRNASFDGVRIYKIGDQIAFRVQKENKTHPYGQAYPINVEQMFHDFLNDEKMDQEKAGIKVIESISKEIKRFFDKSVEVEKEERLTDIGPSGNVDVQSAGIDYSALVNTKA